MQKRASRKHFQLRLDEMVNALRHEIVSGQRAAGKFLPAESELEKLFHLSNNSIRKGLDILVQEGLIEKIPRVGNRVAVQADKRTIVKFGMHSTTEREADMVRLLAEFQDRHPHIEVQTVALPPGYSQFVRECMENGMLDVVMMNNNNFQDLAESGYVDLLEPLDVQPDVYPFLNEPFMRDGRVMLQPFIFSPVVLCYNRDHFREKGIPEPDEGWTWEDLFDTAQRLAVENERFGFYFHLLARNRWPVFLLQSGLSFEPDGQGRHRISRTGLIESLAIGRKLLAMPDVFPVMLSASEADAEELFLQGNVSMIMTTYFALNELEGAKFAFDVAPLPHNGEGGELHAVIGVAVSQTSRVKEEAKLFVEFLASYETQLSIRRSTYSLPVDRRAAEWNGEGRLHRPSRYRAFLDIIPRFRLLKDLGLTGKQLAAIRKEIKLYWTGLADERQLCERIEQLLDETSDDDEGKLVHLNSPGLG